MDDKAADRGPGGPPGGPSQEGALVTIVQGLVRELRPKSPPPHITTSSRLEQDLGVDSLARTELSARIERIFRIRLPLDRIGQAETVGDLMAAIEHATPGDAQSVSRMAPAHPLPPAPAPGDARTLIDVLEWHVAHHPDRLHLTVMEDDRIEAGAFTYEALANRARRIAAGLVARDVAPGDRVAIMLPTGLEFFAVFFGVLYAGAAPVPIYPPMRLAQIEDHLRRQAGILRNAGAKILVTMPEGLALAALLRAQVESLESVESAGTLEEREEVALPLLQNDGQTALIQYTSGSTGDPKGVVLSHANLLANIRAMGEAINASSSDVFVSWLPLYHDMGLIGAWLGSLYYAAPLYVMSPLSFLTRPANWLWAIHRFRATLSAAPNFGFELCVNKIDEASLEGLDLGSLRMVANGAEPVSVYTLRRFIEKFGRYGFKQEAMAPVYGLAENAVGLAFPPPGRAPLIDRVDRDALTRRGLAQPARADDPKAMEFVSSGQPLPRHEIRIVDANNRELAERREGRLEFHGPSATAGYYRNETKARELIRDGWLDSGDRAYMANGDVFITGRIKDIIIRAGRHLYPQEIEEAVGLIPGMRKGCVAVFGALDPRSATERVVVVAETAATDPETRAQLTAHAQQVVSEVSGAVADEIVLVPPHAAPKTSSGKIRRSAAKALYEQGCLGAPKQAVWRQLTRLAFAGLRTHTRRFFAGLRSLLYACWWWTAAGVGYVIVWLGVMTIPSLKGRWAFSRMIAGATLRALRVPVEAKGLEHIPPSNAALVFNHSSYADAILLAATLPGEPVFIAKKELAGQLFAGPFLRRLGAQFVERFDMAGSLADVEMLAGAARTGRNIVLFPEGTFTRRAGLTGFYLGAFRIAAEAGLAVVPGALCGTRSMLRGGQWFPRWSALSVEIGAPLTPEGADFAAIVKLRDEARKFVLAHCGEPDLDQLVKPRPLTSQH
ncbi:acyl-[acyl-carrier-protein]-phospholipid O-acyltransferase / long-chain-fatty-acid--[acyl-carrier-protein] ligase [freshwater sediment metagenome]|uniref:Acyl-[acyl-carrier-protein]-phospholipid O-acyltransferase / long-chain-fatty-acid--[acyl-carrier-protein] ligase n=1 Tax=freshwater sediment metagenome TaxID=556182 RepID=A0AA48LXM0_9ZZZZ